MEKSSKASPAQRFGVWAGRWWKRWRGLETRQLERAQVSGKQHGALLVRCAFRLGDLALLAVLLLVGYWVVLPVLFLVGLVYLLARASEMNSEPETRLTYPSADEIDHIEHPGYWPDMYDDSGNLK